MEPTTHDFDAVGRMAVWLLASPDDAHKASATTLPVDDVQVTARVALPNTTPHVGAPLLAGAVQTLHGDVAHTLTAEGHGNTLQEVVATGRG